MLRVLFSPGYDLSNQCSALVLGQRLQLHRGSKPSKPRAYSQNLSRRTLQPCTPETALAARGKPQYGVASAAQNQEQLATNAHSHVLLRHSLLSGTSVTASSDVVVLGNVEFGATLSSPGSLFVFGRLDGTVRAGPSAVLVASQLGQANASIGGAALPSGTSLTPVMGTLQDGRATWHPVSSPAASVHSRMRRQSAGAIGSSTCRTALITGCYITVAGVAVLLAPHTVFGLFFKNSELPQGWMRVLGTLAALFGIYWLGAAWGEATGSMLTGFYQATVLGRLWLAAVFAWLVASRQVPWGLWILGALNAAGAVLTALALRKHVSHDATG